MVFISGLFWEFERETAEVNAGFEVIRWHLFNSIACLVLIGKGQGPFTPNLFKSYKHFYWG